MKSLIKGWLLAIPTKAVLLSCVFCTAVCMGDAVAQEDEGEAPSVFPVDIWACDLVDGKGWADFDAWVEKFNDWMGQPSTDGYSAWRLIPYYFGSEQEFDYLWLGASRTAVALGKAHERYLEGHDLIAEGQAMSTCSAHMNFAAMTYKEPPESNSKTGVLSFSDCTIMEDKRWEDLNLALKAWADYRTEAGSKGGIWIMWPVFGGGDADYHFKFLEGYDDYVELGVDYDEYGKEGWKKAEELFEGLLDCDDARVYNLMELRDGITDEE